MQTPTIQGLTQRLRQIAAGAARDWPGLFHDNDLDLGPAERRRNSRWIGVLICLLLGLLGYRWGAETYLAHVSDAEFYQRHFGPALSLVCTGSPLNIEATPDATAFLNREAQSLDDGCADVTPIADTYDRFMPTWFYLQTLIAASWALFGISWSSLFFAAGILTAGMAVATYLFLRCFCSSRLVTGLLTALVVASPMVTEMIPHIRDFAKAPLILFGLAFAGRVLTRDRTGRTALVLAALTGIVVGLANGVRSDVILVLPIAILAFLAPSSSYEGLRGWAVGSGSKIGALFAGVILGSLPVWLMQLGLPPIGSNNWHVFILGFAENFYDALGMGPAHYSLFRQYLDEGVMAAANLHAYGAGDQTVAYQSADYASVTRDIFVQMVATTPLDVLKRVLATINTVWDYPLNAALKGAPVLAILLVAAFTYWRGALFLALLIAYLGAIFSLQLHPRHNFYAVALGAATFGTLATLSSAVAQLAWRRFRNMSQSLYPFNELRRKAVIVASTLISVVALALGVAALAAARQEHALTAQVETYRALDWRELPFQTRDGSVSFNLGGPEFQTLGPPGHANLYGYGALDIVLGEPPATHAGQEVGWSPVAGRPLEVDGDRIVFRRGEEFGYQYTSTLIERAPGEAGAATDWFVDLTVDADARASGWGIGALRADGSAWIGFNALPVGNRQTQLRFNVPATEASLYLIIDASETAARTLTLHSITISQSVPTSCAPRRFSIQPILDYHGTENRQPPQPAPASRVITYYLPLFNLDYTRNVGFDLSGVPGRCVARLRAAAAAPAGMLPMEILDLPPGAREQAQRASWGGLLRRIFVEPPPLPRSEILREQFWALEQFLFGTSHEHLPTAG